MVSGLPLVCAGDSIVPTVVVSSEASSCRSRVPCVSLWGWLRVAVLKASALRPAQKTCHFNLKLN